MSKSENTLLKLEAALQRILDGQTKRIPDNRKLSVRAVEEEAGLGNGSCYYYGAFKSRVREEILRLKIAPQGRLTHQPQEALRHKFNQERKVKIQYREKAAGMKRRLAVMAAEHHQLSHALRVAHSRIEALEKEITALKQGQIVRIK